MRYDKIISSIVFIAILTFCSVSYGAKDIDSYRLKGNTYMFAGNYQGALESWEEGLKAAEAVDDKVSIARYLYGISIAQTMLGNPVLANKTVEKSYRIMIQCNDYKDLQEVVPHICAISKKTGDTKLAIESVNTLKKMAEAKNDEDVIAFCKDWLKSNKDVTPENNSDNNRVYTLAEGMQRSIDNAEAKIDQLPAESREEYRRQLQRMRQSISSANMDTLTKLTQALNEQQWSEAEKLLDKAVTEKKKSGGNADALVYDVTDKMVKIAVQDAGSLNFKPAFELYDVAMRIREKYVGEKGVFPIKFNLASLYWYLGNYVETEAIYSSLLPAYENKKDARSLISLAWIYEGMGMLNRDLGRYEKAADYLKRSIASSEEGISSIEKEYGSTENIDLLRRKREPARTYILLGEVYRLQGRVKEAEEVQLKAASMLDKKYGDRIKAITGSDKGYKTIDIDLVPVYLAERRLDEAEKILNTNHEIRERLSSILGSGDSARFSTYQAMLHLLQNDSAKSIPVLEATRKGIADRVGKEVPEYSKITLLLALACEQQGQKDKAADLVLDAIEGILTVRENAFLVLPERDRRGYNQQSKLYFDVLMSLNANGLEDNPARTKRFFGEWLHWKGSSLDMQKRLIQFLHATNDPEFRKWIVASSASGSVVATALEGAGAQSKPIPAAVFEKKDAIEAQLIKKAQGYGELKRTSCPKVEDLLAHLGQQDIYIDFIRSDVWNLHSYARKGAEYWAFVVDKAKGGIQLVRIGEANEIDSRINELQTSIRAAVGAATSPDQIDIKPILAQLSHSILSPIEKRLEGKARLLLVPDGALHNVPFEALTLSDGTPLIERLAVANLSSGRDLLYDRQDQPSGDTAVIFADPAYDRESQTSEPTSEAPGIFRAIGGKVKVPTGDQVDQLLFRLEDTEKEANAIKQIVAGTGKYKVNTFLGQEATEDKLRSISSPRFLHIATHGFFKNLAEQPHGSENPHLLDEIGVSHPVATKFISFLALAGAKNSLRNGKEDGLLTPDKVLGLDLHGTDVVVLSACNSGLGDVDSGEGIFGLKRSFILAGSKFVVTSFWPVASKEAAEFMETFYRHMLQEKKLSEAFRLAKIESMKKCSNPYLWGAFSLTGL